MSAAGGGTPAAVFFEPRSVALVGVSQRPDSITGQALGFLQRDFRGPIYPVNPRHEALRGLRCYPSLTAIEDPPDLVLSMVPAEATIEVIEQAGAAGARGVSVFASGFAEAGPDGRRLQQAMVAAARRTGVRLVGPNCQGTINFATGASMSYTRGLDHLLVPPGQVAYLGQSGALGSSLLNLAQERGLGFSLWASTGNQADLGVVDLAHYAVDHEPTRVLALYLEDVNDGFAVLDVVERAIAAGKDVVVLRSGRTTAGRRASQSHTGSMIGDDLVAFDLAAGRAGAILVDDVDEVLDVAAGLVTLARGGDGRRLGVVTTSGAAGILAADHCEAHGFELAELSAPTQQRLAALLPPFGSAVNPVDVTYQFFGRQAPFLDRPDGTSPLEDVVRLLAESGEVDVILLSLTMLVGDLARALVEDVVRLSAELDVALLFVWLAGEEPTREARAVLRAAGIPAFVSVQDALRLGARLRRVAPPPIEAPPWGAEVEERLRAQLAGAASTEAAGAEVLATLGVAYPDHEVVVSAAEAAAAARRLGGAVALKLQVPGLTHKTEAHGVRLGVAPEQVQEVASVLLDGAGAEAALLVARMEAPGLELLVSARQTDPRQPPVVTIGLGGIQTELHRDLALVPAPAARTELRRALERLRVAPLLHGHRGSPPLDVEAVVDIAWRLGWAVARSGGRLRELELNPVVVHPRGRGATALDVLVTTVPDDRPVAVQPADFPWLDYRRYSYSLAVRSGGALVSSGQTAAAFDTALERVVVAGDATAQTGTVYDKLAAVLSAAGHRPAEVVRVVEHLPARAVGDHAAIAAVRRARLGVADPAVTTVVVERLLRSRADVEISLVADRAAPPTPGGPGRGGARLRASGDLVHVSSVLPLRDGIVAGEDHLAQTEAALEAAERVLVEGGFGWADVARMVAFTVPADGATLAAAAVQRATRLAGSAAVTGEVLVPRMVVPGALVQLELTLGRRAPVVLTRSASAPTTVQVGRTVLLSLRTAPTAGDDVGAQAAAVYADIAASLAAAGAGLGALVETVEFVTPAGFEGYRRVGEVRTDLFDPPYPASTGVVCTALADSDALIAVEATAVLSADTQL